MPEIGVGRHRLEIAVDRHRATITGGRAGPTITVERRRAELGPPTEAPPTPIVVDRQRATIVAARTATGLEVYLGGRPGPRGPRGPAGSGGAGGGGFYRHHQAAPATAWVIAHGLGYRPAVTVEDSAGSVVTGDVAYVDDDTLTVSFASAFGGYANLS
jgi:hypothetical protein